MFASQHHRRDFADTRSFAPEPGPGTQPTRHDRLDVVEQLDQAEAADRQLLRLVVCAAGLTLALALAGSLI